MLTIAIPKLLVHWGNAVRAEGVLRGWWGGTKNREGGFTYGEKKTNKVKQAWKDTNTVQSKDALNIHWER
jgi:hypothetical protein